MRAQDPRVGIAAGADGAGLMAYVSAAMLVEELREFTVDRWIGAAGGKKTSAPWVTLSRVKIPGRARFLRVLII